MDYVDWKILERLQSNGRMTYTELAGHVHLSAPAMTERVKRLEEVDVIEGDAARVNSVAAGYVISAMLAMTARDRPKRNFTSCSEHYRKSWSAITSQGLIRIFSG